MQGLDAELSPPLGYPSQTPIPPPRSSTGHRFNLDHSSHQPRAEAYSTLEDCQPFPITVLTQSLSAVWTGRFSAGSYGYARLAFTRAFAVLVGMSEVLG